MKTGNNPILKKRRLKKIVISCAMMIIIVVMVFPFYIVFVNSFKNLREFYDSPIGLPHNWYLGNYQYVIGKLDYFGNLLNNAIVLISSLVFIILFGSLAGFVIARRPGKLKKCLYMFFVLGITLPTFTMLIPQVKLIGQLGLKNNYLGLILLYVAGGMPMSLFLYTGFFGSVPQDLEDAAKIDGCSLARMYRSIFFPISTATSATLIMLQSISIWNDYVLPDMVMTKEKFKTLMPALQTFYGRMLGQGTRWDYIYAFVVLCIIPVIILYCFVNKYLIRGVIEGALKG